MESDPGKDRFNLRLLIVDDNHTIRIVLGEMLKPYSSDIIFAENGKQAVSAVENNPAIDLIFMDVYMHNMDGFEATRKIREINKKVIIFVITAAPLSELVEDFAGTLINDYFPKPFNQEYLNRLILKHFKKEF